MPRRPALRAVSAATAVAFALWSCGPGVGRAWAADGPSIAVVGVHGNGEQDERTLRGLSEDLAAGFAAAGLDVRSGEPLSALLRPERDRLLERVHLAPVNRAFDEGRILYEKAQPEQAIAALDRAAEALEEAGEFLNDGRLNIDVPLYLGLSWIALGQLDKAEPAFADVVRADPDRVLDSLDYPPNIVETFDRVRARVLSADLASISVRTAGGESARVFLDGRLLGTAPVEVAGLPPGRHTVLVEGGAAGRSYEVLALGAGAHSNVEARLQRLGLAPSGSDELLPARSGLTRRLFRELAASSGASLVAVAAFDEAGDLQLALYSGRSGTFSEPVTASLAGAPGARGAFVRSLAERTAQYADANGGIKPERVASEGVPLRLGGNPTLTDLLLAPIVVPVATGGGAAPAVDEPTVRTGPHPAGVVALIVGGLLAGAGAGVAIWAGTRPVVDPGGALVIEFP